MSKNKAINSDAFAYLKSLLGDAKILDVYVRGRWLTAEFAGRGTGGRFSVKNQSVD